MALGDDPPYSVPAEIYRLCAECYQAQNEDDPYPELGLIPDRYKKMAKFYKLAGDLQKASEMERKLEKLL